MVHEPLWELTWWLRLMLLALVQLVMTTVFLVLLFKTHAAGRIFENELKQPLKVV